MARRKSGGHLAPKLIAVAVASCFAYPAAWGNPTGAQVVNGTVGFARPNASTLRVTNSPGAIINWQGFSIGAGEVTRFVQQSSSSAVLNRVVGADISTIQGQLLSNGRVFLINPSGILIGAGAVIDTAGFVGSTLQMQDADFLAGKLKFQGDGTSGRIVNQGWIRTTQGGQVMLVAPQIENSGLIHTPKGELILAAGRKLTISSLDHEGVQFEIQAPTDSVVNVGKLLAEGGAIGAFAGTLKHSGEIRAASLAVDATGQIVLKAQKDIDIAAGSITSAGGAVGGKVQVQSGDTTLVSGSIEAKGSDGKGGTIHILGDKVGLMDRAHIDASGEAGGGTVLVGGDFQGKNPAIQNAFRTYVGPDAVIKADAVANGDGGKVIVWSDDATRFYGSIFARGGAAGDNGGFAEVSGKNYLDYRGHTDLGAPAGATGVLLLDPNDVEIRTDVASGGGTFDGGTPNIFGGGNTTSQILWNTIKTNLAAADVHITTTGTQGVNGDITVVHNSPDLATSHALRLLAHNNVTLNGSITNTGGGALGLYAGWDGNNVTPGVNAGAGQMFLNAPIAYTGNVFLHAGEDINQAVGASIGANRLLARSVSSFVHLNTSTNSVTTLAGEAKSEFRFKNDKSLTIGSVTDPAAGITVQGVTVDATGIGGGAEITITTLGPNSNLAVNKNVTAVASGSTANAVISLTAGRHLTVTGSSISATATNAADIGGTATVTLTANTGNITLNSSNISATGGNATSAGAASVTLKADAGSIMVNNSVISATAGNGIGTGFLAGGISTVTLQADAGNITVGSGSTIAATGGGGDDSGGAATVTLKADLGSITVDSSSITATGGSAPNATGGAATAELLAQTSLDINNSSVSGNGGSGFTGGAATVTLQGTTGGITVNNNSSIVANGGAGGSGDGGSALANLTGAGVTLDSSSAAATGGNSLAGVSGGGADITITATGANINFIGSDVTATGGAASINGAAGLDIIAGQGAILQSGGGVLQVGPSGFASNFIDLQARDGIGTAGAPIRVASGFGSLNVNNAQLFAGTGGDIVIAQTTGDVNLGGGSPVYTFTNGATNGGLDIRANAGSIIVPAGPGFSPSVSGPITLRADSMDIQGTLTAAGGGTGIINIRTTTAGRPIQLGTIGDGVAALALSDAELGFLNASSLTIGRTTGGALTITAPIILPVATFLRGSTISQDPLATITSPNGLDVAAAGTVTLTESNSIATFSGTGTSMSLATLGSLDIATPITSSGSVTLTTGGTITGSTGGTDVTAGSLTLNAGTGIGTLANPFSTATGTLSANAGTGSVNLANTGNLSLTNVTALGGADITTTGNITVNGPINTGGSTAQLGNPLGNRIVFPVSTTITAGSLILNSSDTRFTGGIVTLDAPVQASQGRVAGAATLNLNGATSDFESITGAGNIVIGGGTLNVGVANADMTYSGDISGTGSLTKLGSGNLTLSGQNTYTGATMVSAGNLTLEGGAAIANTAAVNLAGSVTGLVLGANERIGSFSGGTGATVDLGSHTLTVGGAGTTTFAGQMNGTGGLTKLGSGNLTLSGANTYTGATRVNAGTLSTFGGAAIDDGSAVVMNGGTLSLIADETIGSFSGVAGSTVALGGNTLTVGGAANTSFSGVINGTGGLTKQGGGTLTLSGANAYTGATRVNAGTLALGASNVIANGSSVIVSGGTLDVSTFSDTVAGLRLVSGTVSGTTGVLTSLSTYDMRAGTVSADLAGAVGLDKTTGGTLTLSGTNTYTGTTTVNAGELVLNGGAAIVNTGAVDLAGSGRLTLGANETIGPLTGVAGTTVDVASHTLAVNGSGNFAGVMTGSGGLTKQGGGTLTLSGANAYTGATRVNAGTLSTFGGAAIDDGSAVVMNGGTLSLIADETIGSLTGPAGTVALGGNTLTVGNGSFGGVISSTVGGGLTKQGPGTLTLSGANTSYLGTTSVNAGALRVASDAALGSGGGGTTVAAGAAVEIEGSGLSIAESFTLNGPGVSSGGALRNLANANEVTGAITLGSATRISSDSGTLTLSGGVNNNGSLLTVGGAGNTVISGGVAGAGGLAKQNGGALTLSGTNTYAGATTVNAGTLVLDNASLSGAVVNQSTTTVNGSSLVSGGVQHSGTLNLNDVLTVGTEFDWQGGTLTGGGTLAISGSAAFKVTGAAVHTLKGPTISATNLDLTGGSLNLQAGTVNVSNIITVGSGTTLAARGATIDGPSATLDVSGTFQSGAGSVTVGSMNVLAGGLIKGTGTLNTDVNNSGTVSPGLSPGILTINGNYVQAPTGTLNMEIGGTIPGASGHDQLVVTGTATLGGTLNASLINGFVPTTADSFTLLKASSVTGTFATTNLPAGTFLAPSYLVSSLVVSTPPDVVTTLLPVPPVAEVETERLLKTVDEGLEQPQKPGPTGPLCL